MGFSRVDTSSATKDIATGRGSHRETPLNTGMARQQSHTAAEDVGNPGIFMDYGRKQLQLL